MFFKPIKMLFIDDTAYGAKGNTVYSFSPADAL
jgi:hypothetical protein